MNATLIDLECSVHVIFFFNIPTANFFTEWLERFFLIQFREEFIDVCIVTACRQQFCNCPIDFITLQTVRLYVIDA